MRMQVPGVDVAPPGFPPLAGVSLELLLLERPHTLPAVCVIDAYVNFVLDFLRHELAV